MFTCRIGFIVFQISVMLIGSQALLITFPLYILLVGSFIDNND